MNNKSVLFAISGISGSGKTTTMREIMNNEVVSFTTRKPRQNEIDGKDYIFSSRDEILELENGNRLIEKVEYRGNIYGITKDEFESKIKNGHAFVIVDYHGYKQFKALYDNVVGIYFKISKGDAYKRMLERGDSEESIKSRMNFIEKELENEKYYDYVVLNEEGKQLQTILKVKNYINEVVGLNEEKSNCN